MSQLKVGLTKVENLMEFLDDGNESENDSELDKYSRGNKFRSSRKIIPDSDLDIQVSKGEIFSNFQKDEGIEIEDENDEMGISKSSSSSRRSNSSP